MILPCTLSNTALEAFPQPLFLTKRDVELGELFPAHMTKIHRHALARLAKKRLCVSSISEAAFGGTQLLKVSLPWRYML